MHLLFEIRVRFNRPGGLVTLKVAVVAVAVVVLFAIVAFALALVFIFVVFLVFPVVAVFATVYRLVPREVWRGCGVRGAGSGKRG